MPRTWEQQHQHRFERFSQAYAACAPTTSALPELSQDCIRAFRQLIRHHSRAHRRAFPWRVNRTPYRVLVAEIMLQQTQAGRVSEKYREFLREFPSLRRLAAASPAEVLRRWQGLGYNRRGLALHRAAQRIVSEYSGRVPQEREALEDLPGVGSYTAAAIRTFAFGLQEVVIETNIRTVFIHCFFPTRSQVNDALLLPLIEQVSVRKDPAAWYDALMDYGAMLKSAGHCANQRNPQYRPQTAFKGSRRELRGKLVRELSGEAFLSSKRLKQRCGDDQRFEEVLRALLAEGLVERRQGRLMLGGAKI